MPETDTFLQFKNKVRDIPLSETLLHHGAFKLYAALYDDDGHEQFGLIIIDRRFEEEKKYVQTFSSTCCPDDKRDWLGQVLIRQMVDLIKQSHDTTLGEIKKARRRYDKLLDM